MLPVEFDVYDYLDNLETSLFKLLSNYRTYEKFAIYLTKNAYLFTNRKYQTRCSF